MANFLKIFSSGDGRVFVILHPDCGIARERILDLLIEAGIDPALVTVLTPEEGREQLTAGEEWTIVPVDGNCAGAPELEEAARRRAQYGRVVVVCGGGFASDGLHPIAEKYGSQCGWSSDDLREQITGNSDEVRPVGPTGAPIKRPESNPVKKC